MEAKVRLWSDGDRSYQARLRELSPQADAATRTYAARFTIADADDAVAYGMTATVTLSRPGEETVARLPLSAVLNRGKGAAVFVVDGTGALVLRNVTVASFNGDVALVTSGISNGDRVVTLGVQKLEAGLKVRAVEIAN
jgi:RND family efflux transporter MFP subunit